MGNLRFKDTFCKGEKIRLTASGAASYTWTSIGALTPSVQVSPTATAVYSLTGVSVEGCLNTSSYTLTVALCTGIDQNSMDDVLFDVYPNPNSGLFTIKGAKELKLTIMNELGQAVESVSITENNSYTTSVDHLPSGIYFIVGQDDTQIVKKKLIIIR